MFPQRLRKLQTLLARLPGVGEKTAQRYVLHLLTSPEELATELGRELYELHQHLGRCGCGNLAEIPAGGGTLECTICQDSRRDPHLLCVVGRIPDLLAIERAGAMRGRYFVLGRLLSPLEGTRPEDLPLEALITRMRAAGVTEVILATPTTVEGEATALYLKRELTSLGLRISRIASGVPHGGDFDYADPVTMGRALAGRRDL